MYNIGDCYENNDVSVIIVGQDGLDYIYFIGVRFYVNNLNIDVRPAQIPFLPVHKDTLDEMVTRYTLTGNGTPAPIEDSIKAWLDINNGSKTYYTVPIERIIAIHLYILESNNIPLDTYYDPRFGYNLPISFPTNEEFLKGSPRTPEE